MSDKPKFPFADGKSLFSVGGLALMLVILVLVNVLFAQVNLRWDTTEDNLYSLSEGSKEILRNLKKDVTLKVFYTRDIENMPIHIKNYAKRMLDFVREYETYSDGKVTVEVYNPKPDSVEEEWAIKYGINGADLPTGDRLFFGMVAMAADQEEAIPMFDPTRERQLEYDITRLIARVQEPNSPKIGVVTSLPVFGAPPMGMMMQQQQTQPWLFVEELRKSYEVVQIPPTSESIEPDIDLMILLHPKDLSEQLQYEIDQYVLRGGNAIVFADGFATTDTSRGPNKASNIQKLLENWGVQMEPGKVVADFDYATQLRNQQNQVEENPMWVSIPAEGFDHDSIITSQLESMLMPVAGTFRKAPDSPYEYEPLVQSSANSALTESFRAQFGGVEGIRRDFRATPELYDLAVMVRGKFKTAFPGGRPEKKEEGESETDEAKPEASGDHLKEAEKAANILLVGDADLLFDNFYVRRQNFLGVNIAQMFNDNLNFLLNASEMLTGSEALISIRSRGKFERPFTKVEALEKKAKERWLAREQELMRKVEETNRKLQQLEQQKDASQQMIISPEQEAEIQKFQEEKIKANRELKEVRRNLRAEIESLGNTIKFINIFLTVLLVAAIGIGFGIYRRSRGVR